MILTFWNMLGENTLSQTVSRRPDAMNA